LGEGAALPIGIMVKKKTIENSGYFEESFTKNMRCTKIKRFM
jgi:hypothetical protein